MLFRLSAPPACQSPRDARVSGNGGKKAAEHDHRDKESRRKKQEKRELLTTKSQKHAKARAEWGKITDARVSDSTTCIKG